MKKIVIFGSYNGSSIGDTAILLGLISSLVDTDSTEKISITVLVSKRMNINDQLKNMGIDIIVEECVIYGEHRSKINSLKRYINQKILRRSGIKFNVLREIFIQSDVLLIGGGNLVMDYFPSWVSIVDDICSLAERCKLEYSFIGVGAGPIDSQKGKKIFYKCLNKAKYSYFRDEYSRKYCKEVLKFDKGQVAPDLAFGIIDIPKNKNRENNLMLNIAAVYGNKWPEKDVEKFNCYISELCKIVKDVVNSKNIRKIYIYNTNYPLDEYGVIHFLEKFRKENLPVEIEYIEGKRTVKELIEVCSRNKYALVTRLHAGIIAGISGCQLVAIAYQPKVRDVLLESKLTNSIIDIDDILNKNIIEYNINFEEKDVIDYNNVYENLKKVTKLCIS